MKTTEPKRPVGRPRSEAPTASEDINLRVTRERKARWIRSAQDKKLTLSEWITEACDAQPQKKNEHSDCNGAQLDAQQARSR